MKTRRLPLGIQTFENIRKDGYIYVDKTDLVYRLANEAKFNFLSRPRRFGKSLLLSTLQSYFEGRRDLFEGLKIENLESEWTAYPVLRFDFNNGEYHEEDGVKAILSFQLSQYEKANGIDNSGLKNSERFKLLIEHLYRKTGKQVVILVDEYEKPILEAINNPKLQERHRGYLKPFYATLKSNEQYIRFVLLTGVTKMGHLSIFSDLNNIRNQSLNPQYSTICGFTEEEMTTRFSEYISRIGEIKSWNRGVTIDRLRKKYDGYRFSLADKKVYNPYSLINSFADERLTDYWFESGTPSFLVHVLRKRRFQLDSLEGIRVPSHSLTEIDDNYSSPIPLLYQSGYLTIIGYDNNDEDERYILGYPNEEVRRGFFRSILQNYVSPEFSDAVTELDMITDNVKNGKIEDALIGIRSLIMGIPSSPRENYEYFYRDSIYLIFKLLGFNVQSEVMMLKGCIDCVVQTRDYVYIFEFKANSTAESALRQIEEKEYDKPFEGCGKTLYRIGVNFDTVKRSFTYIIG